MLVYLIDWDDGTNSGWIGYLESGETCSASHVWTEEGTFEIKAKTKDLFGFESEWSDPLPVSMPLKHQTLLERLIEWILHLLG